MINGKAFFGLVHLVSSARLHRSSPPKHYDPNQNVLDGKKTDISMSNTMATQEEIKTAVAATFLLPICMHKRSYKDMP